MLLAGHESVRRSRHGPLLLSLLLKLTCGALVLAVIPAHAQQDQSMAGMNMGDMSSMGNMGSSMAAMAGHMYITPLRPKQPGDEEKAKAW